ncbi:MAG: hybrid sensor histidine kinase/response regulator [Flammeovirgaceae bacterium]
MVNLKEVPVILIADDQPDNLKAIVDILESSTQKYNFIKVPNGKLLIDLAIKKQPDLIITDWEMPEMTGLEAVKELKKYPETCQIPIIMCTGIMISAEDLRQSLEAGAVDYVRKPVEAVELIARVQSMLKLSASFLLIKEQNEELKRLNELKTRLLSVVSHDVKGPLSSLKGILYLFENHALNPDEMKDIVGQIKLQVEQVTDFLENLLQWVKNQLKTQNINKTRFLLNQSIQKTIELLKPIAESKKITILPFENLDIEILADEEMIKVVVRNLISNAIKFCNENDKIQISIQKDDSQQNVKVSIKDTGIGISQENVVQMFGKHNVSTRGTKNEMGTGLGLLICKQYIEANGGCINVESEVNKGSNFWFTLPL